MLYNLGKSNFVSEITIWFVLLVGLLGSAALICVMLAGAVRIGNLIIGW